MDTPEVNTPPPLLETLQNDYANAHREIAEAEENIRLLRWKLAYIKKLLDSAAEPQPFDGMTIADISAKILADEGQPLSLPCELPVVVVVWPASFCGVKTGRAGIPKYCRR